MESTVSNASEMVSLRGESEYRFPRAFVQGNVATFATYAIGAATIAVFCLPAALVYAFYCIASTVAIWAAVCVHCPYYGRVCPCGYSTMSTALFKKGDVRLLPKRYRLIWAYVAPSWIAPPVAAALVLTVQFSWVLAALVVVFVLMAFAVAPAVSKVAGCCEYWRGCTVPVQTDDLREQLEAVP